ncbi:IclR family transcriptional regulator [Halobellus limi]|jgi:IclR family acetate operon transcriptional repressor|uniref:IclR family transcriptional regulator n=1 Tax=Halobellus limi TaxID=699433 RepID=A0A1H5ZP23_9EURY|nr:IclR family transcriptional regulator [Halobellus limi]QCC48045.1 IclR family transcriptional regulator [Halobellus limi]SEG37146.1 transcriptional regulator, IclR family [Halobellus limi]
MTEPDESGARGLQSVERSFDIIEYLGQEDGATLSEAADDLGLAVSTAHIHLTTLVETGYVVKDDDVYRCSFEFLGTGGERRDGLALYQAAKPELDELQAETGEHTNVTVEERGYSVQLYKSESPHSIDDDASLGDHFYLHLTATGKAILAELSDERVAELLDRRGMPALTDDTITDEDVLYDELETIRERGYSINNGEHFPGVCAIGTAIASEPDGAIGAISISGPRSRITRERIEEELAPALLNKKNIIELKIRQFE